MKKTLLISTILSLGLAFPALSETHPKTGEELSATQSYTYWMLDSVK